MKDSCDYAYAVGRVRGLEAKLIPPGVFRSAAEAGALTEVLNILSEAAHAEEVKTIKNSQDLERFLKEQVRGLKVTVTQLLDEEQISGALFSLQEDPDSAEAKVGEAKLEFLDSLLKHAANLKDRTARFSPSDYLSAEKLKAGGISDFLAGARYIVFGPEPVIGYYFGKLNEIRLLRWVILGKINQVPKDILSALI